MPSCSLAFRLLVIGCLLLFPREALAEAIGLAPVMACPALTQIKLRDNEVKSVALVAARRMATPGRDAVDLPEHCLVRGVVERRTGVGGKAYGINWEMRLPTRWNGRFLFQGGGGPNGVVRPAIGDVKGPAALARGFAVISQDAGHEGTDASFGEDQQARVDMIWRSYDRITTLGKDVVAAYYGRAPNKSYFMGCSEGGREALLVSQRLPLDYDGVVAGDPGFQLGLSMEGFWSERILNRIAPRGADGAIQRSGALSLADLALAADLVLRRCDELDGLKDRSIDNWPACRVRFGDIACRRGAATGCLAPAKAAALDAVFRGGRVPNTHIESMGLPYDSGIGTAGWASWKLGAAPTQEPGWSVVPPLAGLFLSPYQPRYDRGDYVEARDWPRLQETGGQYSADAVTYSTFRQRGAKLLVYSGVSDPVFPINYLVAWYERVEAANGGPQATRAFARLFAVPGMNHCRGGPALDQFDPLSAVVDWVENGRAPDRLVASGAAFPGRTRPLCPFPLQSRYDGSGSIEAAENFSCRTPEAGGHARASTGG